jgi:hypothetical protein
MLTSPKPIIITINNIATEYYSLEHKAILKTNILNRVILGILS